MRLRSVALAVMYVCRPVSFLRSFPATLMPNDIVLHILPYCLNFSTPVYRNRSLPGSQPEYYLHVLCWPVYTYLFFRFPLIIAVSSAYFVWGEGRLRLQQRRLHALCLPATINHAEKSVVCLRVAPNLAHQSWTKSTLMGSVRKVSNYRKASSGNFFQFR